MAETVETLVIDRFVGFDPRIPKGACTAARLPREGALKYCSGVEVAPDGSLRSCRDQFRIGGPEGVTVTSLYEVAFESYNQLLGFGSDSKMYVLNGLDWVNVEPAQWDYGYELFNGTSYGWSDGVELGQDGLFSAAEMGNRLYIPRPTGRMKQWDGASLIDVGLEAPATAPYRVGGSESFEEAYYTEVDPDGILDVNTTADTITVSSPGGYEAYVYKDEGSESIGDYDYYFHFSMGSSMGETKLALISVTQSLGDVPDRGQQDVVALVRLAHRTDLWLYTFNTPTQYRRVELRDIAVNTTYYCHFYRRGTTVRLDVYTDSARTTLKNSGTVQNYATERRYRYIVLMNTWTGDRALDATFGGLDLATSSTVYETSGRLPAGTYGYFYTFANDEFESMPSPLSEQIVVPVDGGKIHLDGILMPEDDTVTTRRIYRAYSPEIGTMEAGPVWGWWGERKSRRRQVVLGSYQYVGEVPVTTSEVTTFDDDVPNYLLGEAMPYDYALPPWGKEICFHRDRLWMTRITKTSESYATTHTTEQQNLLYYTPVAAPAYWPEDYVFKVGDGAPIVGLHSWRDYLFIFKTNGTWVLSGYDDADWNLERLDDNGMCAYHAVASSHAGVMWWSAKGLMFFDGARVQTMVPSFDVALTPPKFSDGEKDNWIAFHRGRYYILSAGNLFWYEVETDTWGAEEGGPINGGLRAVNLGENQCHLLCKREWATGGGSEITIVHTGRCWDDYASAGTLASDYHAPVDIRFRPLIAGPEEEIELLEVWVDGNWTDNAVAEDHLKLMVSNDADSWTTVGDLVHIYEGDTARANLVRETCVGNPLYVRFSGNYAAEFRLYLVRFHYVRRQRRAGIPP